MGHLEAQFLTDALHLDVFRKDIAENPVDVLITAHLDEAPDQLGTQPQALKAVTDDQRELGILGTPDLDQAAAPRISCSPVSGFLRSATSAISRS